jgi:hypothetical protein
MPCIARSGAREKIKRKTISFPEPQPSGAIEKFDATRFDMLRGWNMTDAQPEN